MPARPRLRIRALICRNRLHVFVPHGVVKGEDTTGLSRQPRRAAPIGDQAIASGVDTCREFRYTKARILHGTSAEAASERLSVSLRSIQAGISGPTGSSLSADGMHVAFVGVVGVVAD
jgi:hypothetical protein